MKRTASRIVAIALALVSVVSILISCDTQLDIEVGILWRDDPFFNQTGSTYLGILKGQWDTNTGFDKSMLDTAEVVPGANRFYKFSIDVINSDHFTAFIFMDNNDNQSYDDGYDSVLGYKYNYGESGGELEISLSAYY